MKSSQQLLNEAYSAFNARDIDAVLALMTATVDWPNAMENTRAIGTSEVRAYWSRQWAVLDPHVEPVRIAQDASGKHVVDVHQVVRDLTGTVLVDQMVQHIYTIEDGLIARMDIKPFPTNESDPPSRS